MLCADLHWTRERNSSQGFLAAGEAKPVGTGGGSFDFEITVHPQPDLRFVNVILYLSPTGDWNSHTFAATTELIPVTNAQADGKSGRKRLAVYQLEESHARVATPVSAGLRYATGLVWLASAVLLWRRQKTPAQQQSPSSRWRWPLVMGLALAGIWELAGLESRLGDLTRDLARAGDVYYSRAVFQEACISIMGALVVVSLGFGWRKGSVRRFYFAVGLYFTIAAANLLSFHAIDQLLGRSWHGMTPVDTIKLLCALLVLAGLVRIKTQSAPES